MSSPTSARSRTATTSRSSAQSSRPPSAATERAQRQRARRQDSVPVEVRRAGLPVRAALLRVPFVIALIVVLAGGVGSVLYLNTKTDELGMRTEAARAATAQLRLDIESLSRDLSELSATPRIAQAARDMGLVPAGDTPMIIIDADGDYHMVGVAADGDEESSDADAAGTP